MKSFRDLRISGKILGGYLAIALITTFLGIMSTNSLRDFRSAAQSTYVHSTEPLGSIGRVGIVVQRSRVNIRGMLLDDSVERMENNASSIRKNDSLIDEEIAKLQKALKPELREEFAHLQRAFSSYRPLRDQVISLTLAGKRADALDLMRGDALVYEKQIDATIGKLLDLEVRDAKQDVTENNAAAWGSIKLNIGFVVAGVIIALVLGYFLSRSITSPLQRVMRFAAAISSGDLTGSLELDRKDETGELASAMNDMAEKLRTILSLLKRQSEAVAEASGRLTATSTAMANGTEEVASQAQTLAAASEEMAATSNEIASKSIMVAESAVKASSSASDGSSIVTATVEGMRRIAERVHASSETIARLGENSEKIGCIIGTIEDIADQTNLLALNAAIEAARAGEQGRGFAVVADEVRALAERTARATREISSMIQGIQNETEDAVQAMEEGVAEVESGTREAARSHEALEEIKQLIDAVSEQISQIATAAEQQTATTGEIAGNIQHINQVIDHSAQGAHETASEAQEMAVLADDLKRVVEQFKLPA